MACRRREEERERGEEERGEEERGEKERGRARGCALCWETKSITRRHSAMEERHMAERRRYVAERRRRRRRRRRRWWWWWWKVEELHGDALSHAVFFQLTKGVSVDLSRTRIQTIEGQCADNRGTMCSWREIRLGYLSSTAYSAVCEQGGCRRAPALLAATHRHSGQSVCEHKYSRPQGGTPRRVRCEAPRSSTMWIH